MMPVCLSYAQIYKYYITDNSSMTFKYNPLPTTLLWAANSHCVKIVVRKVDSWYEIFIRRIQAGDKLSQLFVVFGVLQLTLMKGDKVVELLKICANLLLLCFLKR